MRKHCVLAIAAALLLPASLQAQHYDRDRDRRHDRRDWSRWRQWDDRETHMGRLAAIISDCENRSDDFASALRRALDRSRLDGTYREHRLNSDARRLQRAMDRLRDSWNKDRDPYASRSNVRMAISAGRSIESGLPRFYGRRHIESEWRVLRAELNRLAEAFDVSGLREYRD
jgi:hypothetical protein